MGIFQSVHTVSSTNPLTTALVVPLALSALTLALALSAVTLALALSALTLALAFGRS